MSEKNNNGNQKIQLNMQEASKTVLQEIIFFNPPLENKKVSKLSIQQTDIGRTKSV